ncbi:carbon-nitrogen hydrolase family protein [Deinococcus petrolearius]|uniref:Carbon-nitrogen hydrolase family protein n=1 Tax=Deinococcus petrolearius TaxID=1751295 RepID=A0ABW1DDW1_9DEIO
MTARATPRALPVAAVQAPPLAPGAGVAAFAADVTALRAAFPQTRLAVYPELHLNPESGEGLQEAAEPLTGPRVRALRELAGDLGLWLVPGSVAERGPQGQLFNTALLLSPEGELTASYRKIFPWRPYEPFDPGTAFTVAELPGVGRLGFSICFDAWFPEVARHLAWMGAEVIVNVVRTTTCDRAQEVVLARATAITNQVFVLSVNAAGPLGTGQSLIVDPEGLVRASVPGAEAAVLTDVLGLDHVERVRTYGTAGLTRVWSQFRPGDPPLPLPLYGGRIDPARWNRTGADEPTT